MLPSLEAKLIGGAVLVLALLAGLLYLQHHERQLGAAQCQAERSQQLAEDTAKARETEREQQRIRQEIDDAKDATLRRVAGERDDALRRLRDRPNRLPDASRASCTGSTGRELSEPDAAFLTGLAARADEIRAELDACQQRERAAVTVP